MKPYLFCLLLGALAFPALASESYEKELKSFRKTLEAMVHADTSNPPGNEARIVKLVAERLKSEGVAFETVEFGPGRECIIARLKGSGKEKPLLLLAHLDVVGAQNQPWSSDPHTVIEKDGYLVGRGVGDDLGMAALELEVFLLLKRSNTPLRRDVILALTGDEESGGLGIREVLEKRPQLLDAVTAINEGGGAVLGKDGKVKYVALQTAEKSYQDFALSTKGTTGHSSVPLSDNAIYRLSRGLDRLSHYEMPAKLIPATRHYFEKRSALEPAKLAQAMKELSQATGALPIAAMEAIEKDPAQAANLRTTCVATMIQGGTKANALPAEAKANVNCRILPGESIATVQSRLVAAVHDPKIDVKIVEDFGLAGASPTQGELPTAVEKLVLEMWPGVPVIPMMSRWATDSRFLRMKGVASYGINPIAMSEADARRAHGIDERISVASLRPGMEFLHRLVLELASIPQR